ncbi:transposase [Chlorogloeopsis sp. ULAP02]|uniref:RNA-guided endonuclease InsQ/TnpB family protein n=1 Tax=Chlorogloeopsis sp. ULAP02 TaxID=3107926 RepID=UPI003136CD7E
MYGCQQILLSPSQKLKAVLEFICSESNKLTNCAIYYGRQIWFKCHGYLGKFDLINEYKNNPHYQVLHSQVAQQTLLTVRESFKSFYELDKMFRNGELEDKPKPPKYRRKGGLAVVTYPKQALKLINNCIQNPLGLTVNRWFNIKNFLIPMPSNIKFEDIKELRILPRNRCFYAEFAYKVSPVSTTLDPKLALGIDPGISNWLTCVSNLGTSFIVDGKKIKSLNQWYNKIVSKLKEGKPQGFWSERLAHITEKRNRQMRDAINKATRIVVNYCIQNQIGNIVFGWNKEIKNGVNLGSQNNQSFVQIPTAKLKERISQLCQLYGIKFVEMEESYTSQSSFLDGDVLPVFGNKPEGWKSSGKRVKRGLFVTAKGIKVNADLNGSANALLKVKEQLNLDLVKTHRGLLTVPQRVFLWKNNCKKRRTMALAIVLRNSLNHRDFSPVRVNNRSIYCSC